MPIEFDVSEKRTHDYVRHGTTNLFAAQDVFRRGYQIRGYIDHWNTDQKPCDWTATAYERAKVQLVQTNIRNTSITTPSKTTGSRDTS